MDQLPGIKGRSYLFRVTDGTTGTPYDISTSDSQLLKEWIDMLQVVSYKETASGPVHFSSLSSGDSSPSGGWWKKLPTQNAFSSC